MQILKKAIKLGYFLIFFAIIGFGQVKLKQNYLKVERWKQLSGINSPTKKQIIEKRLFDNEKKIVLFIGLDDKSIVYDSATFIYNKMDKLISFIEYFPKIDEITNKVYFVKTNSITYFYNTNGDLTDTKINLDRESFFNNNNPDLNLKNPLNLITNDFEQIQTAIANVKKRPQINSINGITVQTYFTDFILNQYSWYGVPNNAILKKMKIFYSKKDLFLMKDEFYFENCMVRRFYTYKDQRIKRIRIEFINENGKEVFQEGFDYSN